MKKKQEKDWGKFYREGLAPKEPTDFCRFIMSLNLQADSAVDLGCGNGRDTKMLADKYITVGIDKYFEPEIGIREVKEEEDGKINKKMVSIIADDFKYFLPMIQNAGIVYSRFFLHSITDEEIINILDNTKKYFCAEFRTTLDEPVLYKDHERNLIDWSWLISTSIIKGFEVLYFYEGRGMAKYKNEDPLVARIVLRRKNVWKE